MVKVVHHYYKFTDFKSSTLALLIENIDVIFYEYLVKKYRYRVKTRIYLIQFLVAATIFNFEINDKNFVYCVKKNRNYIFYLIAILVYSIVMYAEEK